MIKKYNKSDMFGLTFTPFTGDYDKDFYDVLTPSGKIVEHCWPNAGIMNDTHGTGEKWDEYDDVYIRKSLTHPLDKPSEIGYTSYSVNRGI